MATSDEADLLSEGYRRIGESDLVNARILSRALEGSTEFKVLSEIHHEASPNDPGYVEDETKAGHCASIRREAAANACRQARSPGRRLPALARVEEEERAS